VMWRSLHLAAQPDEWLLQMRDGRPLRAGIGIAVWRRPGDVVVRFSSTMQRVGFSVEGLTHERLRVLVDGFIFWSIQPDSDGPFRAYRALGVANLLAPPPELKHRKHLLTSPQHRAFQQLVTGSVQRHAALLSLEALLGDQDAFVAGLAERLRAVTQEMGVKIDQVQLLAVRPVDGAILQGLSARDEERIREEAQKARLEAAERSKRREIEQATRLAGEEADARRDRQAHEAQAQLELERQRAKLVEEQRAVRLLQLDSERQVKAREQAIAIEGQLVDEQGALSVLEQRQRREEAELAFRLARTRREAEAARDATIAVTSAEESKSAAVREHEMRRLLAHKVAEALKVTDGKWITIGNDSPVASLAAVLAGVTDLVRRPPTTD
jgi:flotillin